MHLKGYLDVKITEKQIMQLMELLRELAASSPQTVAPRKAMDLLDRIMLQQSDELKDITDSYMGSHC